MICVIIISLLLVVVIHDDAVVVAKHDDDVEELFVEEKSGNIRTEEGYFRKMLTNNVSVERVPDRAEQRRAPYVFRWSDGKRESGDRLSITPWDDYDFNGSKDYEYQLTYRGCRINYIHVRLLIVIIIILSILFRIHHLFPPEKQPNDSGYCGYLDGGIQQSSVVLAIGAKAVDYFYYGVKIYVKC